MQEIKKITTIGGGKGQSRLLTGLRDLEGVSISSIVAMTDSGGSSGKLRDDLGVLPPGDLIKCLIALSPDRDKISEFLQRRVKSENKLTNHNAGNLLLTMMATYSGDYDLAVDAMAQIINLKARVLPVTKTPATLIAELNDGTKLVGEDVIDVMIGARREKIKRVYLKGEDSQEVKATKKTIKAIEDADYIILSPGDLYTSLIPNLLVSGAKEACQKTKAKFIYVVNIATKIGETDNFSGEDFVNIVEQYLGRKVDIVLANNQGLDNEIFSDSQLNPVLFKDDKLEDSQLIFADLVSEQDSIRHDSDKLALLINQVIK